jgi:uncharacterized protein (DUF1810 family)
MTDAAADLQRFVAAQDPVWDEVRAQLRAGRKTSHWMWFVFPQLRGLGRSAMAETYGIASRAEAVAYWQHALLGPRLVECCRLLLAIEGRSALQIFGSTDGLKLRSSMTLFEQVAPGEAAFGRVLERHLGGRRDELTLALLARA